MGHIGCPETRLKTYTKPCFETSATALIIRLPGSNISQDRAAGGSSLEEPTITVFWQMIGGEISP